MALFRKIIMVWHLQGEETFFIREERRMERMSNALYLRVVWIVLFAAVFIFGSVGFADGSEFRFIPDGLSFSRLERESPAEVSRNSSDRLSAELSDNEMKLYLMIMDYRKSNGLSSIPLSRNLSRVARAHVQDLEEHPPSGACNMHSWSEYGNWKPVCYTGRQNAKFMWSKPRELTDYRGKGYEIAAWTSGRMGPGLAMHLWEGSLSHNTIILNSGTWEGMRWNAIGLAISHSYAVVWFGEEFDFAER